MPTPLRSRRSPSLLAAGWIVLALVAGPLGGCQSFGDVTGSLSGASQPMPTDEPGLRAYADRWGKAYDGQPGEKVASMNYARALRALTRYDEAEAVMRVAAVKAPKDYEVLGGYGKALADAGKLPEAREVLSRSYPAERPDANILSVRGAVEDKIGDHANAQRFYLDALKIRPGEPTILSNLGLSYALSKQLELAEKALREASASPKADQRIRQNLALVLALQGKFGEAEQISRQDMPADQAARNVQAIRAMIAQTDTWKSLQAGSAKRPKPARANAIPKTDPAG